MNIRKKAAELLATLEREGGFANLMLTDGLLAAAGEEAPLLTALFYGAVERRLSLDFAIATLSGRSISEVDSHAKQLLRLGLYQMYFMHTPPYAAVNETVALGENKAEKGFLNAVLREAVKRGERPLPDEGKIVRYLSVRESFPQATVKRFLSLFGQADTEALLAAYNRVAPLTLRLVRGRREDYIRRLAALGIEAERTPYAPRGIRVLSAVSVKALPGFDTGEFFIQDEASQLAVAALDAQKGQRVIDVCACPGGKTAGALADREGEGESFAFDLHRSKLPLIEGTLGRLGFSATLGELDAARGRADLFDTAERVICDVPCSGLGVLGKKPDLRYRPIAEALPALQYDILRTSARYLKKEGILVYSTCTLLPEENGENVARFLEEHPHFVAEDFSFGALHSEKGQLTLLPFRHGTDGFFIARLRRIR